MTLEAISPIDRPTTLRSADCLPEQPTREPDPRRRYSWPADARHANVIRDAVHRWLGGLPLSANDAASMVIAIDAAVENVIKHAYMDRSEGTGTVEIACWTELGEARAEVTDHGTWRARRDRVVSRGIPLMERLIDSVSVETDERGTRVLLRHALDSRGDAGSTR